MWSDKFNFIKEDKREVREKERKRELEICGLISPIKKDDIKS